MIVALSIRSFVLIDQLDLEVDQGFTALTGETGAGKSIILDALGLVLGASPNRKLVRAGDDKSVIVAEFELGAAHPVWAILDAAGVLAETQETLTLRRVVPRTGPSRAFVNDQPVSSAILAEIGNTLVEIHSQHAASDLMRPTKHRGMLDAYGAHQPLVMACKTAWYKLEAAREARVGLETAAKEALAQRDWLEFAVEDLGKLGADPAEASALSSKRTLLLQSERVTDAIAEATKSILNPAIDDNLSKAARATERVLHVQGLDQHDPDLAKAARAASEAIERTLIELTEAQTVLRDLSFYQGSDANTLETVEARLFALRAAGRKYDVEPDDLHDALEQYRAKLHLCDSDTAALEAAKAAELKAHETWALAAKRLSKVRAKSAKQLEIAIMDELGPLHLGRVRVQVALYPLEAAASGAQGSERVEFQVETNPGAGFGPLRSVASGGELARFSLAVKCALSACGDAQTQIFDEADQGVGGAVAAAIGERLARLSKDRQVFAITHSPQVASTAERQWRIQKVPDGDKGLVTRVGELNEDQRLEEIARMLSGSRITDEARAAAQRLLEAA